MQIPPLKKLIDELGTMGFHPRKARIIKLSAKSSSIWHQDGSAKYYQVRLHIPLITNLNATFETDFGKRFYVFYQFLDSWKEKLYADFNKNCI